MSRISEPNIRDSYNSTTSISTLLLLATCLPDACYPSDFFGSLGANVACKTKNEGREMNAGDIAFLYVESKTSSFRCNICFPEPSLVAS